MFVCILCLCVHVTCMSACIPEAWLQGCFALEQLNFVRRETQRINVARLCFAPLSASWESGHVRPNYAFPNQTKWLLLVSTSLCSSPKLHVGVHTKQCNTFSPGLEYVLRKTPDWKLFADLNQLTWNYFNYFDIFKHSLCLYLLK